MLRPISIINARTHNLKEISLDIPRNALVVVTGVSGSGKSSLAFDTLYAEGQRRYVESLSAYARQFLDRMDRPDVDEISGIAPAVAIEQKNPTRSSRSTVGTATELQDYLRLLFARVGQTWCPECGIEVKKDSVEDVLNRLERLDEGSKVVVTFTIHDGQPETWLDTLKQKGYFRLWIDGRTTRMDETEQVAMPLTVVVDRLVVRAGYRTRTADSLEQAFQEGGGRLELRLDDGTVESFSQIFECASCGRSFIEPQPRLFSFNNPFGACPECKGFGDTIHIDPDRVIPDRRKSLSGHAIQPWTSSTHRELYEMMLREAPRHGIDVHAPYDTLTAEQQRQIWSGFGEFPGIDRFFRWVERKKYKIGMRVLLSRYRGYVPCHVCGGSRLRPEALYVRVSDKTVADVNRMNLRDAKLFFQTLPLDPMHQDIAGQILQEIRNRLAYLNTIGLAYLTLNRRTSTLSGGEFQRINLATALGAKLVGSLYILDEPTIGLHPHDTGNLIEILQSLRDIGNTVVVVEHDADVMRSADHIIDLGPEAGRHGGDIMFQGPVRAIQQDNTSLTGAFLSGRKQIPVPADRRNGKTSHLVIHNAREHNLKNLTVSIPLNRFVVVSGVSGSGKSTLINDVLYSTLMKAKGQWKHRTGDCDGIDGIQAIDAVERVDQSPIGKTPRSNPATYLKAFDSIRQLFANTRQARLHGYKPGTFSFNVPGGRCETCEGAGVVKIEMQFLADLYLECEACGGKRYNTPILNVRYHGRNIAEVLDLTVDEAVKFFHRDRKTVKKLQQLQVVGLGYLKLGQPSTTLSGGEAQRIKLAAHLADRADKHILYIFDEPTTGLHARDVAVLLDCFRQLLEAGHSLIVIEHNLDVIKSADTVIDLGPGGGDHGGTLLATGTPEELTTHPESLTGRYLKQVL
jgi:excinuclease ABC subunit A